MSTSAMHVAKTGLTAQQYKMQVIANNLANVNTTGFKRDRANFESLFYQIVKNAGSQTADNTALTSPLAVGTGVKVVSTQKLFTQGGLVSTDNSLDLAIDGSGFFKRYFRTEELDIQSWCPFKKCGRLTTTSSGYVVQPQITIPNDATGINISTVVS
ncbi:MAG: hypothetical protein CM15mP54_10040 [Paracoccaceae bacterium]|nr:MAG: hypothetical protein CM15mP54_10040 [Paracoccaceae bacterium]